MSDEAKNNGAAGTRAKRKAGGPAATDSARHRRAFAGDDDEQDRIRPRAPQAPRATRALPAASPDSTPGRDDWERRVRACAAAVP